MNVVQSAADPDARRTSVTVEVRPGSIVQARGRRVAPARLGSTRSYSPMTAQSKPIMMKKPLNRAIRPIPP